MSAPHFTSRILIKDSAPADNPPSGHIYVYAEAGKLKQKTSAGVVTDFTAGGGGGPSEAPAYVLSLPALVVDPGVHLPGCSILYDHPGRCTLKFQPSAYDYPEGWWCKVVPFEAISPFTSSINIQTEIIDEWEVPYYELGTFVGPEICWIVALTHNAGEPVSCQVWGGNGHTRGSYGYGGGYGYGY
jgi:hypothetical protein